MKPGQSISIATIMVCNNPQTSIYSSNSLFFMNLGPLGLANWLFWSQLLLLTCLGSARCGLIKDSLDWVTGASWPCSIYLFCSSPLAQACSLVAGRVTRTQAQVLLQVSTCFNSLNIPLARVKSDEITKLKIKEWKIYFACWWTVIEAFQVVAVLAAWGSLRAESPPDPP